MKPLRRVALLLLPLGVLLVACGQRGDLYLPQAEREAVVTLPAGVLAPPATGTEEDEADSAAGPPATGNSPNPAPDQ
ncbi:MAG TPA: lipoprotein [Steroidobacteraceae bacterium]|nr:lipoprotein [Steroidobacteraceae bacterium]